MLVLRLSHIARILLKHRTLDDIGLMHILTKKKTDDALVTQT